MFICYFPCFRAERTGCLEGALLTGGVDDTVLGSIDLSSKRSPDTLRSDTNCSSTESQTRTVLHLFSIAFIGSSGSFHVFCTLLVDVFVEACTVVAGVLIRISRVSGPMSVSISINRSIISSILSSVSLLHCRSVIL